MDAAAGEQPRSCSVRVRLDTSAQGVGVGERGGGCAAAARGGEEEGRRTAGSSEGRETSLKRLADIILMYDGNTSSAMNSPLAEVNSIRSLSAAVLACLDASTRFSSSDLSTTGGAP